MDLSIIIVNWNTREFLSDCLHSVLESLDRIEAEVIVVDNASTDASVETVKKYFPWVKLIENTDNRGLDRKSTRLNSSHSQQSRMPSSA